MLIMMNYSVRKMNATTRRRLAVSLFLHPHQQQQLQLRVRSLSSLSSRTDDAATRALLSRGRRPLSSTSASSYHPTAVPVQSSQPTTHSAAFCHHGFHYTNRLAGLHGQQLDLAHLEGQGKDDPDFDPFLLDQLEEQEQLLGINNMQATTSSAGGATSSEAQQAEIAEAELVEDNEDEDEAEEEDEEDDDDDDDDDESMTFLYENNGSVRRSKAQRATLRAGAPAGGLFAVATFPDNHQHKVTVDDVVICALLKPLDKYAVGSVHTITSNGSSSSSSDSSCSDHKKNDSDDNDHDSKCNILLVGSSHWTWVGRPHVPAGASVTFMVEEITMDKKVIVFKKTPSQE